MILARRRRRMAAEDAGVDMTPMLDIVFILLIFFIVTATFLNEQGMPFMQAKGDDGPTTRPIGVFISETGGASVDGEATDLRSVPSKVEVLRAQRPNANVSLRAAYGASLDNVVYLQDQFAIAGVPSSLKVDGIE